MGARPARLTAAERHADDAPADLRSQADLWIGWIRVGAVPFAFVEVGVVSTGFSEGYATWAWIARCVLAAGAAVFMALARMELSEKA